MKPERRQRLIGLLEAAVAILRADADGDPNRRSVRGALPPWELNDEPFEPARVMEVVAAHINRSAVPDRGPTGGGKPGPDVDFPLLDVTANDPTKERHAGLTQIERFRQGLPGPWPPGLNVTFGDMSRRADACHRMMLNAVEAAACEEGGQVVARLTIQGPDGQVKEERWFGAAAIADGGRLIIYQNTENLDGAVCIVWGPLVAFSALGGNSDAPDWKIKWRDAWFVGPKDRPSQTVRVGPEPRSGAPIHPRRCTASPHIGMCYRLECKDRCVGETF